MSPGLGGLLKRIGHYSLAKIAIMAAGLVSFPILTRVLTPAEYGIMGVVVALLNVAIGISKMGLGSSVVRLWPEWEQQEGGPSRFILTCIVTITMLALPVVLLTDGVAYLVTRHTGPHIYIFIVLASPLIAIRALNYNGLAVLQAREWSLSRSLFEVATAYAAMILSVLGAAVVIGGLRGYYIGLVAGEATVLVALLLFLLRDTRISAQDVSRRLMREAIAFGFPIAIFEMSGVLFYTGDRFLIVWLLDEAALGFYTVAFNLAQYVNVVFTFPVVMAVGPAVTNIYEREGQEAASRFLSNAARYYLMFALPAIAGMTMIRADLLVLLASEQFRPGAELVHILVAGFLLAGSRDIVGVGMFLKKRPWMMAGLNMIGAALNAGLNLALIPWLGTPGAAVATLTSQFVMTVVFWRLGSRMVPVPVDLLALLRHVLCAAAMGAALIYVDLDPPALRMVARIAAGVVVYGGLLLALDRDARRLSSKVLARLRGGGGGR